MKFFITNNPDVCDDDLFRNVPAAIMSCIIRGDTIGAVVAHRTMYDSTLIDAVSFVRALQLEYDRKAGASWAK